MTDLIRAGHGSILTGIDKALASSWLCVGHTFFDVRVRLTALIELNSYVLVTHFLTLGRTNGALRIIFLCVGHTFRLQLQTPDGFPSKRSEGIKPSTNISHPLDLPSLISTLVKCFGSFMRRGFIVPYLWLGCSYKQVSGIIHSVPATLGEQDYIVSQTYNHWHGERSPVFRVFWKFVPVTTVLVFEQALSIHTKIG